MQMSLSFTLDNRSEILEEAADEVLLYMRAYKLAANPEKTKCMMIGIKK
jgi:hypothetical protein